MIELKNIYKEYRNGNVVTPVLEEINLNINDGEFVAVVGTSGSGKTTLLNIIGLMDKSTSGTYYFNDSNLTSLNENERSKLRGREISFVFQNFGLIDNNTVRESVELPLLNRKIDRSEINSRVKEALKSVGLADYDKRKIKQLSGGQKQRLSIARAIIKDAPIYIFDDSFSALDFLTEKNLRAALNEKIRGRTQIVVTQRITSAMSADCIFVMDKGCLVDYGKHDELLSRCRIYQEIFASQTGGGTK